MYIQLATATICLLTRRFFFSLYMLACRKNYGKGQRKGEREERGKGKAARHHGVETCPATPKLFPRAHIVHVGHKERSDLTVGVSATTT